MRLRPLLVGVAAAALIAATPAAANHMPFYGYMGIIEITSVNNGTQVSYNLPGFAPGNWSGGCVVSPMYDPLGAQTTTVSCTPPAPPRPFDVNYCAIVTVAVSSTAPAISPGIVSGTSACSRTVAAAAAPAGGANGAANSGLAAQYPWTCTATAPPTVHPWTVRCTLTH